VTAHDIEKLCKALKGTTQDIKWKNDLCFLVGGKMYCVCNLNGQLSISFKTTPEEFGDLIERDGIIPAPYVANHHWVLVENSDALKKKEWEYFIRQSYEIVFDKLTKKIKNEL
jgi:predicted DNA-binding protein (MmcQ/YjbR family)